VEHLAHLVARPLEPNQGAGIKSQSCHLARSARASAGLARSAGPNFARSRRAATARARSSRYRRNASLTTEETLIPRRCESARAQRSSPRSIETLTLVVEAMAGRLTR